MVPEVANDPKLSTEPVADPVTCTPPETLIRCDFCGATNANDEMDVCTQHGKSWDIRSVPSCTQFAKSWGV